MHSKLDLHDHLKIRLMAWFSISLVQMPANVTCRKMCGKNFERLHGRSCVIEAFFKHILLSSDICELKSPLSNNFCFSTIILQHNKTKY